MMVPLPPPLPLPIPLPLPPVEKYVLYSGNFTGSLRTPVNLVEVVPLFLEAVSANVIRGVRYIDATTKNQTSAGYTSKLKEKTTHKTKRKRKDFDHQISIFWKKGFHVKLFKTGRMLIPACGSAKGAREVFSLISNICKIPLDTMSCNNQNIRIIFPTEVNCDKLFDWMKLNGYSVEKTKSNRVKLKLWWNSNYNNEGKCICCPRRCDKTLKRKRGFETMEGKCLPSTVMLGKKSCTVFGTHFNQQREEIADIMLKIARSGD